ncbi:MAG: hypothetical protein F6K31_01270 [Symploca sp. SIO2G7]|nr:hypothetical protein [Symploca sp. SIO2G7]
MFLKTGGNLDEKNFFFTSGVVRASRSRSVKRKRKISGIPSSPRPVRLRIPSSPYPRVPVSPRLRISASGASPYLEHPFSD